jgi:hypothetical protein
LWSGAATTAQVRQAGLLTGPTDSDPWLDQLLTSRPAASLLDYF